MDNSIYDQLLDQQIASAMADRNSLVAKLADLDRQVSEVQAQISLKDGILNALEDYRAQVAAHAMTTTNRADPSSALLAERSRQEKGRSGISAAVYNYYMNHGGVFSTQEIANALAPMSKATILNILSTDRRLGFLGGNGAGKYWVKPAQSDSAPTSGVAAEGGGGSNA